MKTLFSGFVVTCAAMAMLLGCVAQVKADTFVYVGSWNLGTLDGAYGNPSNPYLWTNNPQVYSGVEAAALLFGGNAADYAISTVDSNPADINFLAFVDGWGDDKYLQNPTSDTYSYSAQLDHGYNGGFTDSAFSALVVDHAPFEGNFVNYAFLDVTRANAVPEPSSIALLGLGALGWAIAAYRRRRMAAV